jgi:hypothetical protein
VAVVVMVAAASVAASSVPAVFEVPAFAAALPVSVFAVDFVAVIFAALVFTAAFVVLAFAGIGSAIEILTIGSSSLTIFGTRSFIIRTLTTDTIPMAIILTATDTTLTMDLFTKAALDIPTL